MTGGGPFPQNAVHREKGHRDLFDVQQQSAAAGFHFVEGVGNGDSQVYQNDQGVENVIAAADEIVGCADINDGADPPPQGLDLGAAMAASCSIVYGRAVQSVQISLHYSDFRMECKQSFPVLRENLSDSRETAKTGRIFQWLSEFVGVLKIHSAGQKIFCMLAGRTASVRPACFSD